MHIMYNKTKKTPKDKHPYSLVGTSALNQSFEDGRGGALHCKLTPSKLLDSLTEEVLAKDNVVRRQLTTEGDQSEGFCVVSPQVALDKNGKQVTRSNYYDH